MKEKPKKVAERVGFEPTDGTLEIKMLLENCGLLVPSAPLASPFVPVDSASSRVRRYFPRNLDLSLMVRPDGAPSRKGLLVYGLISGSIVAGVVVRRNGVSQ